MKAWLHGFLASALEGGELSASHPGSFIRAESAPAIHWVGDGLGPTVNLDAAEKRLLHYRDSNHDAYVV
jgi:hypothetical protein